MVGYSGTPLIKKLGIKDNQKVYFKNPPDGYVQSLHLPQSVSVGDSSHLDFIQNFVTERNVLEKEFSEVVGKISKNGALWISWPKMSSGARTDLNENIIREIGLKNGVVDVKVIAIDEIWSGLKFVYRLIDRKP